MAIGLLWLAAAAALFGLLRLIQMRRFKGVKLLETRPLGYSPEEAHRLLSALGPSGRASYAQFEVLDFLFIVAVTEAMLAFNRSGLRRVNRIGLLHLASWLPVAYAASDVAEDLALLGMIVAFPRRADALVRAASRTTSTKFGLFLGSAIVTGVIAFRARRTPGDPAR
jgi:hypothetical protein